MNTVVTFIIPVRHQENSSDWNGLKANLAQTIASISAQTNPNWRAVIVANHGADLPELPSSFEAVHVDFPPNSSCKKNHGVDMEVYYDAFRVDKGRRVLSGMLHARDTAYFMIVDDDDFVSNGIVEFVAQNAGKNGWRVREGYVWGDGGQLLFVHDDFSNFCGTSLIVRSDLYNLPQNIDEASVDYIKNMLGSHIRIGNILADNGTPLADLPFRGAIYRVGHVGAHSQSPKILKMYIFNRRTFINPFSLLKNILKLRLTTSSIRRTYFGGARRSEDSLVHYDNKAG
jgi:hypothetical protein